MFIYTQPCVKEGFKAALGDAYSSEDKVEFKMRKKKEGKEKNQCQKVTWSHVKIYFLAVNADVNIIRLTIWWP